MWHHLMATAAFVFFSNFVIGPNFYSQSQNLDRVLMAVWKDNFWDNLLHLTRYGTTTSSNSVGENLLIV